MTANQRAGRSCSCTAPGVRANIFRPPSGRTIVDCLLDAGYDVWLENWRASIDVAANKWTLDQAAVHDHPAAVRKVVEETGADRIRAIVHCQGSTSFMLSAVAGLVPQVSTIVSNAVSLHPVVPRAAAIKQRYGVGLFKHVIDYMNPQWGRHAPTAIREVHRPGRPPDAPRVRQRRLQARRASRTGTGSRRCGATTT